MLTMGQWESMECNLFHLFCRYDYICLVIIAVVRSLLVLKRREDSRLYSILYRLNWDYRIDLHSCQRKDISSKYDREWMKLINYSSWGYRCSVAEIGRFRERIRRMASIWDYEVIKKNHWKLKYLYEIGQIPFKTSIAKKFMYLIEWLQTGETGAFGREVPS